MSPIADPSDETMLHWVNIAILDMARKIDFIADQMFPESTLPDATFVGSETDGTRLLFPG
jgi:hypothetical protein